MKCLALFRQQIKEAANGDAASENVLRIFLARVAANAPRHSLLKICRFLADEIYPDADRDAAEEN